MTGIIENPADMSRGERKRVGGGGVQYVLSMRAAFQWFCYDNGLLLSALHHRRKQQTRVKRTDSMLLNPHNVPHDETQPNARGGSAARGGRGVRGWTWECIPSCSVVAGPAVPHPAFNRHPVPFICWSTRDAISWPHVTNAERLPTATHEKSSVGVEM
jgi:hypothetical protein